jgi:hypothetical protein
VVLEVVQQQQQQQSKQPQQQSKQQQQQQQQPSNQQQSKPCRVSRSVFAESSVGARGLRQVQAGAEEIGTENGWMLTVIPSLLFRMKQQQQDGGGDDDDDDMGWQQSRSKD